MKKKKGVVGVVLGKLIGLIFLLAVLAWASNNKAGIENQLLVALIDFFNQNLGLIVLYSIIFLVGELCSLFMFPFNLISPPINAVGSIYLVGFIFLFFEFLEINRVINVVPFAGLKTLITVVVFILVLVVGVVKIILNLFSGPDGLIKCRKEKETKETKTDKSAKKKTDPEWEDVGKELRLTIMDGLQQARKKMK